MTGILAGLEPKRNAAGAWDLDVVVRGDDRTGACFDRSEAYRYVLWRELERPLLGDGLGTVLFVGLNPSTADEQKSDPTCTREMDFAERWGFDRYVKCNMFGYRSTDPLGLAKVADPLGPDNLTLLSRMATRASLIVVCWGDGKGGKVKGLIAQASAPTQLALGARVVKCFGVTQAGNPKHPLYLARTSELVDWRLARG